ncbi:NADH-ubiquinone oxidoreductase [Acetobacter sp. DsW_063]|uniref:NAD(P)H-binding protein n=1 Tax=Acetobacter sp. DsW_063 TaxID=1514894 RepID=UPI000A36EBED|nr:NADH-ubiquinone oxidoreductase [Acetobacter sp. DsW_063]OUJ14178.1 NADH-ubiquinone oxidoreductase [Acetobacter sp. DsW_063]
MNGGAVHVIGAGGRSGAALCKALLAQGRAVVPVVRDDERYRRGLARAGVAPAGEGVLREARFADLEASLPPLRRALADATTVVCTAHARNVPVVLSCMPERAQLVCLGSTRKFTRWPDAHGDGVLRGERALLESGRPGVILHPTMIYGAEGENNVQRLAALLRLLPVVPLPAGGRALVQPIHQSDVTASVLAAIDIDWRGPKAIVIAGAAPVSYRDFVRMVADAAGVRRRPVLSVPAAPLIALAGVTRAIPGAPDIGGAEVRRLLEDKAFNVTEMRERLGVTPLALQEGLERLFGGP